MYISAYVVLHRRRCTSVRDRSDPAAGTSARRRQQNDLRRREEVTVSATDAADRSRRANALTVAVATTAAAANASARRPPPLEAKLAARDDDGAAADLHALEALPRTHRTREEARGALQLGALLDFDLAPRLDSAVAKQVHRQWPGGRPRGGILGHAAARSEHARLPATVQRCEAV